jgi:hypothetical protein
MLPFDLHPQRSNAVWLANKKTRKPHPIRRIDRACSVWFAATLQTLVTWTDRSKQRRALARRSERERRELPPLWWPPLF